MKIAFVIHDINSYGGQERSTLEIVNRCARFHDVSVYANTFQGLAPSVKAHRVPVLLHKPLFLKDFIFRLMATVRLFFTFHDLVHITGSCSLKADVVAVQFCQARWWQERRKLPRFFGAKRCLENFQAWYDLMSERLVHWVHRHKTFIALSDEVANDLTRFYGIRDICVIPHGVDLTEFSPAPEMRKRVRAELQVADGEILLLFVGTFERKGLFFLLPAVRALAEKIDVKLCVVGSGPMKRARALVNALGLGDRVLFTGHSKLVSRYYQASDLFILPSLYDPFGLVGAEALASGLPSIVSRQSGVSSMIKPLENGMIINHPESSGEIEEALRSILSDRRLLEKMKLSARKSVCNESWDQVWPKYRNLFEKGNAP